MSKDGRVHNILERKLLGNKEPRANIPPVWYLAHLFLKKIYCSVLHGERMKHLHDLVEHMSYDALKAGRSTFQNFQGPLISFFTSQVAL